MGEKFQEWTDQELPLSAILDSATLYWFTETISKSLYPYRNVLQSPYHDLPEFYIHKPFGFSFFPNETTPTPIAWVATTGDLMWSRTHEEGGHFAALERPEIFLRDVEDFVATAWS